MQGFLPGQSFNTPADGYWSVQVRYRLENETLTHEIPLTFTPTGDFDFEKTKVTDLELVNDLMQPMIRNVGIAAFKQGIKVDFWKIVNFLFVTCYWALLADLGQTTSTTYPVMRTWHEYRPEFSSPIHHSDSNNIWVNDTLYSIYSDLLLNTVLPLLNVQVPTIKVAPLNETNRLHATNTTFLRTYICNVRRMKAPLPAIVSIIVSEYAFVKGGYSFFLFLATLYEKTKGRERNH